MLSAESGTDPLPVTTEAAEQERRAVGQSNKETARTEQGCVKNFEPPVDSVHSNKLIITSGQSNLPVDIDTSRPQDFDGYLATSSQLPAPRDVEKTQDVTIFDCHGQGHSFKSLLSGPKVASRVLIIFIRHFFCGMCQMYLRSLSESITPEALLRLPVSTSITIIGCGDPGLINTYAQETGCPFPIYTDPKRFLFEGFGMIKTLEMGSKPVYVNEGLVSTSLKSIFQGLKQLPRGLSTKSGDYRQVGGEFLFESVRMRPPEKTQPAKDGFGPLNAEQKVNQNQQAGEKQVVWCHRMKTTRDHAEISDLTRILGLEDDV